MRKRRAFRPVTLDSLEDRVVLSTLTAAVTANVNTSYSTPTINYSQIATSLNQDFNTFRADYTADLNSFVSPGTGTAITQAQLQADTTQFAGTLMQQLEGVLEQVPGAASGVLPFITNEVQGTYGGDLLSTLNNIPGTTGTGGAPSGLYSTIANSAINTTQLVANDLLSTYVWGLEQGASSYGSATTPQAIDYNQVAAQLNQSFSTFGTGYNAEENNFINASTSSNPVTLSQLQAYTIQNVGTLATGVQTTLGTIVGAGEGLTPFILNQINGTYGGDLLSTLNGIPGTTGTGGGPDSLYATASTDAMNSTQLAANDLLSAYNWGLNDGNNYSALYTNGGNGNVIDQAGLSNALSTTQLAVDTQNVTAIQNAYQTFITAYNAAITNTLDANPVAGPNNTVNLSANQAAFNAQVAVALNTLDTTLGAVYATAPGATSTFLPSLQQSLTGANSLEADLGGLALPTDVAGTSSAAFTANADYLINQSYLNTIASANLYELNNNFNFNTYTSTQAFLNGPYGAAFANYPATAGAGLFSNTPTITT